MGLVNLSAQLNWICVELHANLGDVSREHGGSSFGEKSGETQRVRGGLCSEFLFGSVWTWHSKWNSGDMSLLQTQAQREVFGSKACMPKVLSWQSCLAPQPALPEHLKRIAPAKVSFDASGKLCRPRTCSWCTYSDNARLSGRVSQPRPVLCSWIRSKGVLTNGAFQSKVACKACYLGSRSQRHKIWGHS